LAQVILGAQYSRDLLKEMHIRQNGWGIGHRLQSGTTRVTRSSELQHWLWEHYRAL